MHCVGPWHLSVCLSVCLFDGRGHGQNQSSQTLRGRGRCMACQLLLLLVCLPPAPLQLVQNLVLAPCRQCTGLGKCSLVFYNFQFHLLCKPCTEDRCRGHSRGFCRQLTSLAFLPAQPLCISTPCSLLLFLQSSSTSLQAHFLVYKGRILLLCTHQI